LEVRRGGEPIRSPFDFIQFAIFFPTLVAGPIKRYTQFLPALAQGKVGVDGKDFAQGLTQVAGGFFKKTLLADNFAAYTTANIVNFPQMSLPERWLFLFSLSFRIYFDFSGYSDIALGLARMMGVDLPANFNWPYIARNMQDFWQRWHISLSSWIRDYVYIPLGGSRYGTVRRITNGAIAFALCGLWHGASWHFLLWGLYHGFGLAISTTYRQSLGAVGKAIGAFFDRFSLTSRLFTFLFVSFGWLLFFYPVTDAWSMAQLLFSTVQKK
jgi:alginate O-acetyltransferase complex protein AlgI